MIGLGYGILDSTGGVGIKWNVLIRWRGDNFVGVIIKGKIRDILIFGINQFDHVEWHESFAHLMLLNSTWETSDDVFKTLAFIIAADLYEK